MNLPGGQVRVFAYLRVSTIEQLDGGGHDRQLEAIKKFCEPRGWIIFRTFHDQQSGGDSFASRRKLNECLAMCRPAIGVNTIVVERADRIARDMIEQEVFFRECAKCKVLVYAADIGEELVMANSDPGRKMVRRILGAMAEWEKDQIARKLLEGRRRKKFLTGKPCGGPPAWDNKEVISRIVALRCQGLSYSQIVKTLTEEGLKPKEGGKWFAATVKRIFDRESLGLEYYAQG